MYLNPNKSYIRQLRRSKWSILRKIISKFKCKPHFKQLFALKGNYTDGFLESENKAGVQGMHPKHKADNSPELETTNLASGEEKKNLNFGGSNIHCKRCMKNVFLLERVLGPGGDPYHKNCMTCTTCLKVLDAAKFAEKDKVVILN
jgi:hypothetical protein